MAEKRKKILWVDDDIGRILPYKMALELKGHIVQCARSVWEAERVVRNENLDLVILDVMIPTMTDKEVEIYDEEEIEHGLRTGLVFYQRLKAELDRKSVPILVLSVRVDRAIKEAFLAAGLPPERYWTKLELRETPAFVKKIEEIGGFKAF